MKNPRSIQRRKNFLGPVDDIAETLSPTDDLINDDPVTARIVEPIIDELFDLSESVD